MYTRASHYTDNYCTQELPTTLSTSVHMTFPLTINYCRHDFPTILSTIVPMKFPLYYQPLYTCLSHYTIHYCTHSFPTTISTFVWHSNNSITNCTHDFPATLSTIGHIIFTLHYQLLYKCLYNYTMISTMVHLTLKLQCQVLYIWLSNCTINYCTNDFLIALSTIVQMTF